jgi:hypothetical protein
MNIEDIDFIGAYDPAVTYAVNEVVLIDAVGYYMSLISAQINNYPQGNPEIWGELHPFIPTDPIYEAIAAYNSETTYLWGQAASSGGKTYISIVYDNLENAVTDVDFWLELTEYEELPACGAEFIGPWKSTQTYLTGQVVNHNSNNYTAVIETINREPGVVEDKVWKRCSGGPALTTTSGNFLYDPSISIPANTEVISIDGFRAKAIVNTQGADIQDTQFFIPSSNSGSFDVDTIAVDFDSSSTKGNVYDYNGGQWLALDDADEGPKLGDARWKKIGASTTVPDPEVLIIEGESIVTKPQGVFMGERTLVSNFYMKFKHHVYHWKNNDQWRLHNQGTSQTVDGAAVDFLLCFYISYKGLRKIIDFIHILTNSNTAFHQVDFESNFVDEQSVLGTSTDRYKIKESEHRIAARALNSSKRVRGNWIKVTIQRKKTQTLLSFNITAVNSKSRNSH